MPYILSEKNQRKMQEIVAAIDFNQPPEILAAWWNRLNACGWPKDLEALKPPDYMKSIKDMRYRLNKPILEEIEKRISRKDILQWHHIRNLGRTADQFEKWWTASGEERTDLAYNELANRRIF